MPFVRGNRWIPLEVEELHVSLQDEGQQTSYFLKQGYKSVTHSFVVYGIRSWIISAFSLALCSDTLYPGTPGSEVSFARQHNTSDNNNQCLLGSNGNVLLQLNPQKPGAIDNQPLVTQEPVKVKAAKRGKADFSSLSSQLFYVGFFSA